MKIDKAIIEEVLAHHIESQEERRQILVDIEQRAAADVPAREITPQTEKRNVTILLCSSEDVPLATELAERAVALTFRIESEDDHTRLIDSLMSGARLYNEGKRPMTRVSSLAEACEVMSPKKHLEKFPEKIYTKEPALILVSENLQVANVVAQDGGT
jgi:hypothetical protein